MQYAVHHADLANSGGCGRRARCGKAHREQRVRFQQRAVGIGDLIRAAVQYVESIELDAPAVVEAITDLRIEEPGRWRDKGIVFGERTRPEIAIAQCREPAGFFAEPDPVRSDYVRRARTVVARSIPDLSGGKTGEPRKHPALFPVVATERRIHHAKF